MTKILKNKKIGLSEEEERDLEDVLDEVTDEDEVEISENFKKKIKTIYEAAIVNRTKQIREEIEKEIEDESDEIADKVERIAEESSEEIEKEIESLKDELEEGLDRYLSYVSEEWMKENRVAIESGYRVKVAESIISGVKKLVEENNIEVEEADEEKHEELEESVRTLQAKYDALFERYNSEKTDRENLQKRIVVESLSEGMTMNDSEKFKDLVENISYEGTLKDYVTKLETIKESYFKPSMSRRNSDFTEMLIEESTPMNNSNNSNTKEKISSNMQAYLASLEASSNL